MLSPVNEIARVKKLINDQLFAELKGVVQSGPFKGMQLLPDECWSDGGMSAKLLGCYEQELHLAIEEEIERLSKIDAPKIVNIGCAEGYYAVGLARNLPKSTVYAIDCAIDALKIVDKAGVANGVENNLRIGHDLDEAMEACDFFVLDCEGAEVDYLDLARFPDIVKASILVECHETPEQPTTKILAERFKDTHDIMAIIEGWRDPNKFSVLVNNTSSVRWLAVSEGRPCMMNWLYMKPKS